MCGWVRGGEGYKGSQLYWGCMCMPASTHADPMGLMMITYMPDRGDTLQVYQCITQIGSARSRSLRTWPVTFLIPRTDALFWKDLDLNHVSKVPSFYEHLMAATRASCRERCERHLALFEWPLAVARAFLWTVKGRQGASRRCGGGTSLRSTKLNVMHMCAFVCVIICL